MRGPLWAGIAIIVACVPARCQELEPRAYSVSPVGLNFLVTGFGRSSGDLSFDPTLPVQDGHASLQLAIAGYARTLDFFGRSANVAVQAPYVWGNVSGVVSDVFQSVHRSGLGDPSVRFAVNLWGAPAMNARKFARYRQRTTLGASIVVTVPLGQYDPAKLVNIGSNRWAFKPELGLSRRLGRWYIDFYAGAWLFAANSNYQGRVRTQEALGSGQFHVSYNFRPRVWAAFDANFYAGGDTSINGVRTDTFQRNSRLGGTFALPLSRHNALKVSVSTGAVTRIGGAFTTVAIGYQYLWGAGL